MLYESLVHCVGVWRWTKNASKIWLESFKNNKFHEFQDFHKICYSGRTSNNHNFFPWQARDLRHSSNWSSQYSWIFSEMPFIFELQDCPQILVQSRIFNDFLVTAVFSGSPLQNQNRPAHELLIELNALRVTCTLRGSVAVNKKCF